MYAYIYSILSTLSPAFYHLIPSPISFSFSTDEIFTFISLFWFVAHWFKSETSMSLSLYRNLLEPGGLHSGCTTKTITHPYSRISKEWFPMSNCLAHTSHMLAQCRHTQSLSVHNCIGQRGKYFNLLHYFWLFYAY